MANEITNDVSSTAGNGEQKTMQDKTYEMMKFLGFDYVWKIYCQSNDLFLTIDTLRKSR